jgi:hypothetical protein
MTRSLKFALASLAIMLTACPFGLEPLPKDPSALNDDAGVAGDPAGGPGGDGTAAGNGLGPSGTDDGLDAGAGVNGSGNGPGSSTAGGGRSAGAAGTGSTAGGGQQPGGAGAGNGQPGGPGGGSAPGVGGAGEGTPGDSGPGDAGGGGAGGDNVAGAGGAAGAGSNPTDPDENPYGTGPTGGDGNGGAGGGSGGGAGGDEDAGQPLPPESKKWMGRWTGHVDYQVPDGIDFWTGDTTWATRNSPLELDVGGYEKSENPGWGVISGRISAGTCILSTTFEGQVFEGDDLSPIKKPILSLGVLGQTTAALTVHMMLAGNRSVGTPALITGTISFSSQNVPDPCGRKSLAFTLEPLDLTTNVSN